MRFVIEEPKTQEDWNNLPSEFLFYLNEVDSVRQSLLKKEVIDPLYPSYDYDWEVDSDIPFNTILYYWNRVNDELVNPDEMVELIQDELGSAAWDDYCASAYSY